MVSTDDTNGWSMGPFDRRMLKLGATAYLAFCLLLFAGIFTIPVAQPTTYQHIVVYTICLIAWGFTTYFITTGYERMGDFASQYKRAYDCRPEWAAEVVDAYLTAKAIEYERTEDASGSKGFVEVRFEFEATPGLRVAVRVIGSPSFKAGRMLFLESTGFDDDYLGSLARGIDMALSRLPPPKVGGSGADGPPELVLYGPDRPSS